MDRVRRGARRAPRAARSIRVPTVQRRRERPRDRGVGLEPPRRPPRGSDGFDHAASRRPGLSEKPVRLTLEHEPAVDRTRRPRDRSPIVVPPARHRDLAGERRGQAGGGSGAALRSGGRRRSRGRRIATAKRPTAGRGWPRPKRTTTPSLAAHPRPSRAGPRTRSRSAHAQPSRGRRIVGRPPPGRVAAHPPPRAEVRRSSRARRRTCASRPNAANPPPPTKTNDQPAPPNARTVAKSPSAAAIVNSASCQARASPVAWDARRREARRARRLGRRLGPEPERAPQPFPVPTVQGDEEQRPVVRQPEPETPGPDRGGGEVRAAKGELRAMARDVEPAVDERRDPPRPPLGAGLPTRPASRTVAIRQANAGPGAGTVASVERSGSRTDRRVARTIRGSQPRTQGAPG